MQSQYLFRRRFASLLQSRRRKSYRCLGQKEKLSSGSWMGFGFCWVFFLPQARKTHCEGKEEGKEDRSHAGGMLGQAASMAQGNGLAPLSGSPCPESSALSGTHRARIEPGCPVCARWERRQTGGVFKKEKAIGVGWSCPSPVCSGTPSHWERLTPTAGCEPLCVPRSFSPGLKAAYSILLKPLSWAWWGSRWGGPRGSEGQRVCCFGDGVNGLTGLSRGILI